MLFFSGYQLYNINWVICGGVYYLERGGVTVSAVGFMGKPFEPERGDLDFGDNVEVGCGEGLLFDNEEEAAAAAAAACIC